MNKWVRWVLNHIALIPSEKIVLMSMIDRCHKFDEFFFDAKEVSAEFLRGAGISEKTFFRDMRKFERMSILTAKKKAPNKILGWVIHIPEGELQ